MNATDLGPTCPTSAPFLHALDAIPALLLQWRTIRSCGRFAGRRLRLFAAAGMNAKVDIITILNQWRADGRITFDAEHGFISLRDVDGLRAATRQDE